MQSNEYDEYIYDEHGPPRRWVSPVVWSGLGLLAFIIYEATMQPALASVALCIKFGWEDFRTAFWLKRHDPYRPRGRACRALYFAYGLCKVALMAMALLLIFSIVEGVGARQGQPAQANPVLDLPFLTAIFGCWLLAVISCWAFWLAFYYGFRLWLHPGVHSDRRQQRWPPGGDYRPADNRVGCLLFFGLFFVFFHVIIILLIMLLMPGNGLVQIVLQGFWLLGALLTILIGLPVAMLALYAYFVRRFAARSPQECWAPVAMRKPRLADNYDYWAKEAES